MTISTDTIPLTKFNMFMAKMLANQEEKKKSLNLIKYIAKSPPPKKLQLARY